ncbi:MAG: amidohydrolase family protein [Planctomycetes bacterium]|nr:amidohydrolase family protein [Planctomycetota bacterium]
MFEAARVYHAGRVRADAAVLVERGKVRAVYTTRAATRRARGPSVRKIDLGDCLLAPAFVNAHAHLELSGLEGRVARGRSFADWIRALIAARGARTPEQMVQDARVGAERLLATGTTLVGDIDSTGAITTAARGLPLVVRRFREALDAGDGTRVRAVMKRLAAPRVRRARFHEGLSPHAPYTISARLWHELGSFARARRAHVAIHLAETRAEIDWLSAGRGPLARILKHAPMESGLTSIARAGLLGPRTLLVHANHVTREERAQIAASGAAVVHCPGTHRFFARESFAAREWLAAGVPLALGTDSLASNEDLDMGRELALFAASQADLAPEEAFACATRHGAAALGCPGITGEIAPGSSADFAVHDVGGARGAAALATLVHGRSRLVATFVRGVQVGPQTPL